MNPLISFNVRQIKYLSTNYPFFEATLLTSRYSPLAIHSAALDTQ